MLNVFKPKFQVSRTLHSHKNVHEHRLVHVQAHTHRKIRTCSHRTLCECRHTHGQRLRETACLPDFLSSEKLFYSSADKRCRGQLCPSRLRDTTSKRDHKIFFILNFKEGPISVLTLISLAFFFLIFGTLLLETFS